MLPDQLGSNERLGSGQSKISNDKRMRLALGIDGNLILSDLKAKRNLWASGTKGTNNFAFMHADGNLVVADSAGRVLWQTNTGGHKDAHLIVQNDGNLVVYKDNKNNSDSVLWDTFTYQFVPRSMKGGGRSFTHTSGGIGGWIGNAVKSAGRAIGSAVHVVSQATGQLGKAISSIPVVGPALHGIYGIAGAPYALAADIASGQRIDRAFLNSAKTQLADIKEVAPYAQTVIAIVPGIGPGVSGAISAGLAIASGQSISQAMIEGVKGAIPGGALGQSLFNAAGAIVEGKDPIAAGIAALPVPEQAKQLISSGLQVTQKLASGQRVDKTLIDAATAQLPPVAQSAVRSAEAVAGGKNVAEVLSNELQKAVPLPEAAKVAMNVGVALSQGKNLQTIASQQLPKALPLLGNIGNKILDPVVQGARKLVPAGAKGFDIGIGLMQHQIGVHDFQTVRNLLTNSDDKKAFDMATSLHVGRIAHAPPKNLVDPAGLAGFYATKGMMGAPVANKVALMKSITLSPQASAGAKAAIIGVANARKGWWQKFKEWIGIEEPIKKAA